MLHVASLPPMQMARPMQLTSISRTTIADSVTCLTKYGPYFETLEFPTSDVLMDAGACLLNPAECAPVAVQRELPPRYIDMFLRRRVRSRLQNNL